MTPLYVKVEQALAFGRSEQWITRQLGVTTRDIERIREWLNHVNTTPDSEHVNRPLLTSRSRRCRRGHDLTDPANVVPDARARCRPCRLETQRRSYARTKAAA